MTWDCSTPEHVTRGYDGAAQLCPPHLFPPQNRGGGYHRSRNTPYRPHCVTGGTGPCTPLPLDTPTLSAVVAVRFDVRNSGPRQKWSPGLIGRCENRHRRANPAIRHIAGVPGSLMRVGTVTTCRTKPALYRFLTFLTAWGRGGPNVRHTNAELCSHPDRAGARRVEAGFQHIFRLTEEICERADQKRPPASVRSLEAQDISADWRMLCRAALQERDPKRLPVTCERARRAVIDRICELRTKATRPEREELDGALRKICLHERKP